MPRPVFLTCLVLGLGGLVAGATGPLLSTFVPPLVQDTVGDRRMVIGAVMAIDNVLLLLIVPLAGAASDRINAGGGRRLPLVIAGYVLAAAGMATFPVAASLGLAGLVAVLVVHHTGINLQRSPFQALVADAVPSAYRAIATSVITFQMCVGAILFLMLGQILGMRPAFIIAAGSVLGIAVILAVGLPEPPPSASSADTSFASLLRAAWAAVRGAVPGLRPVFLAALLLQLTFQTFTTWYALHAVERFGIRAEDVTIGFMAWALGGVFGALPAGVIALRVGRRNTMLIGFAVLAGSLLALDRMVTGASQATPIIALASASWTLPTVAAYPLFVEPIPREHRGILAALYLLAVALGGAIGDPLNGRLFDLYGGYRPMFLMMAGYTALALLAMVLVPRGAGEAGRHAFPRAQAENAR